ncbi:hypothetical protein FRIGORI9N_100013 [Frigoribacterium sp. 9N]|nr:hypothetical protein FRIGORI9N_100013 [Frigoribacterium sp. 9N]
MRPHAQHRHRRHHRPQPAREPRHLSTTTLTAPPALVSIGWPGRSADPPRASSRTPSNPRNN